MKTTIKLNEELLAGLLNDNISTGDTNLDAFIKTSGAKTMKPSVYYNHIVSFDVEFSKLWYPNAIGEEPEPFDAEAYNKISSEDRMYYKIYSLCYLGTFVMAPFEPGVKPDITKFKRYPITRTAEDLATRIEDILEDTKAERTVPYFKVTKEGKFYYVTIKTIEQKLLIYSHNLGVEYSFLASNKDFLARHNPKEVLADNTNKPFQVKFDTFELRCSYKLLGSSIKSIGDAVEDPKLELDYEEFYTPVSQLPDEVIEYCYKDSEIALEGILSKASIYEWWNSPEDMPLTKTSCTRKQNKLIGLNKRSYNVIDYKGNTTVHETKCSVQDTQIKKATIINSIIWENPDIAKLVVASYTGGVVAANLNTVGTVIAPDTGFIIGHNDFASEYPFVMETMRYPCPMFLNGQMTMLRYNEAPSLTTDYFNLITQFASYQLNNRVSNMIYPCVSMFRNYNGLPVTDELKRVNMFCSKNKNKDFNIGGLFLLRFTDVEIINRNSNMFPLIAATRRTEKLITRSCFRYSPDATVIQGKLLKAHELVIALSDIDLLTFLKCYTYSSVEIIDSLLYNMEPNWYFKEVVNYYGHDKIAYKEQMKTGSSDASKFFNKSLANFLRSSEKVIEEGYKVPKEDLNAQYGCCVENPFKDKFTFDDNYDIVPEKDSKAITEANLKEVLKSLRQKPVTYLEGIYITGYAHSVLYNVYEAAVIDFGAKTLYCDTDSWFYLIDETAASAVEHNWINVLRQNEDFVNTNSKKFNKPIDEVIRDDYKFVLGIFEAEKDSPIKAFASLGPKSYALLSASDELIIKKSGFPNATKICNGLIESYDLKGFKDFCLRYFKNRTVFRNINLKPDYSVIGAPFTYNGIEYKSGVVLVADDYSISNKEYKESPVEDNRVTPEDITGVTVLERDAILISKYLNRDITDMPLMFLSNNNKFFKSRAYKLIWNTTSHEEVVVPEEYPENIITSEEYEAQFNWATEYSDEIQGDDTYEVSLY